MLDLLLPPRCPVCRRSAGREPGPCAGCRVTVPAAPALAVPPGLDRCISVCAYDGGGVAVVAALKFRGERSAARWAAVELAGALAFEPARPDAITWVPTTPPRRRRRGVDQAEVLARALGRATGLPVRALLRRRPGPAQEGRSAVERRAGPSFEAAAPCAGARLVVVDDVVTTGASVSAAARALRAAGAETIVAACLARTPPGRHRPW